MTESSGLSRREILLAATGLACSAIVPSAEGALVNASGADLVERRRVARHLRVALADYYSGRPLRHHPTNGDEEELSENGRRTYIGNYSKGLPHNELGEVDHAAYKKMLDALESGDPGLFEEIPLGGLAQSEKRGNRLKPVARLEPEKGRRFYRLHSERALLSADSDQMRLIDPQAGLAFDLEGPDSHELVMPAPPGFRSKEIIAEMAESYWMGIARDIPFLHYGKKTGTVADAIANLSDYEQFKGPKEGSKVTAGTVFRGSAQGEEIGPFVSQFLVREIPFGAFRLEQRLVFGYMPDAQGERDFLLNEESWLKAQRGIASDGKVEAVKTPKFIFRGRDLANFVHIDELFQAYLNAALILATGPDRGGLGAPHDEGNPYDGFAGFDEQGKIVHRVSTQFGFGTLGGPNISSMVAEIASRALKAVWYQKWFVHRRLRPEVYAGRIHYHQKHKARYPFQPDEFKKLEPVLKAVATHNKAKGGDGLFLPMAFNEGSPTHPAYGAGHATVAGACVTVLKAFYQTDVTFAQLGAPIMVANEDGTAIVPLKAKGDVCGPYSYDDLATRMTVLGELNKLASNISLGRNFAGVHWRSDHTESLRLGEELAIQFLRETVQTYNERVSFHITRFDATKVVISNI